MVGFSDDFLTLDDVYVAYRKAKAEAFYERTNSSALAFTEYEEDLIENLEALYLEIVSVEPTWFWDLEFIGEQGYIPKGFDISEWNSSSEGHFQALDPLSHWEKKYIDAGKRAKAEFRLIIRPSVNFQILSALWIIKVGHLFDATLNSKISHGNRLRRTSSVSASSKGRNNSPLNLSAIGLFVPYFSAYRSWREKGLEAIETALVKEKSILAITMAVEKFYHRVSPRFLLRPRFLKELGISLSKDQKEFTEIFLTAIETWYRASDDFNERPEGALPVGLSASKVISNVLLAGFDNKIIERLKPLYYGRYVDDIFLVFENKKEISGANEVVRYLAKSLRPELKISREKGEGEALSLRLYLPYANDSRVRFVGKKQKIFSLSSAHGLDLVSHIKEQIREQSSEYRLLPVVPDNGPEMAARALLATKRLRNDCLVALTTFWPGYLSFTPILQPKFVFAHGERKEIRKLLGVSGFQYKPNGIFKNPIVYIHKGFCFSVLICSDFTNISHRDALRGRIDALFIPEWNQDIKTFAPLVESAATDLHAYIVQVNNRQFGDGRIRAPAEQDWKRDVVQVKGGVSDYYVLGEIEYHKLRMEQKTRRSGPNFKPLPIGYKMAPYRKKYGFK